MNDSSLLTVDHVLRTFGGLRAVDDVSFSVAPHVVMGIVGPNGAGKTVLLNLISGVYRLEKGSIRLREKRIDNMSPYHIAQHRVARTFQSMEQFHEFRGLDYVMLGRLQHQNLSLLSCALSLPAVRQSEARERRIANLALERVGLLHVATERMADVPYGVQKQLDLARILAAEPDLMLLDEPTSGTTSSERSMISSLLTDVAASGATMVIVDHDVQFISAHSEQLLVMNYGQVLAVGKPSVVLARPDVIEAYLGIPGGKLRND